MMIDCMYTYICICTLHMCFSLLPYERKRLLFDIYPFFSAPMAFSLLHWLDPFLYAPFFIQYCRRSAPLPSKVIFLLRSLLRRYILPFSHCFDTISLGIHSLLFYLHWLCFFIAALLGGSLQLLMLLVRRRPWALHCAALGPASSIGIDLLHRDEALIKCLFFRWALHRALLN